MKRRRNVRRRVVQRRIGGAESAAPKRRCRNVPPPVYLANSAGSWMFGCPKRSLNFGRPQRPNAIWCAMKIYVHHYFQHITHLLCQDSHFWEGGGLHILSWDRANRFMRRVADTDRYFQILIMEMQQEVLSWFNSLIHIPQAPKVLSWVQSSWCQEFFDLQI